MRKFFLFWMICICSIYGQTSKSWYLKNNFGITLHYGYGRNYVSGSHYEMDYWYAFNDGPEKADDSKSFLTAAGSKFVAIYFDFKLEKIFSLGIEQRSRRDLYYKTDIWDKSEHTWWRGYASIKDDIMYWVKVTFPDTPVSIGKLGEIGSSYNFQVGYSPKTVMYLRADMMKGLPARVDASVKGEWAFDYGYGFLLGGDVEWYMPWLPICLGASFQGGMKGPIYTKCIHRYSNYSGSYIEIIGEKLRGRYNAPLYWGFDFYLRYFIPFRK
jgi:hypothetical protein